MAVYVFGDSHAHYAFARCSDATTFWLGPRTMHGVGRDGAQFIPHLIQPKPDDTILLVFGEIDVRCHIARIAPIRGRPVEYIIGELVDRYVVKVRTTLDHFGITSRTFMLGVPPPMAPIVQNPKLPVYGPLGERIAIRRMLNAVLEEHARAFGIGFVPIPAAYEAADGSMRPEMSDGHAHIAMDHAHHVCRAVGERIGMPLRSKRPSPLHRLYLSALRARAIRQRDAGAMWDLGRLAYNPGRHVTGVDPRPLASPVMITTIE